MFRKNQYRENKPVLKIGALKNHNMDNSFNFQEPNSGSNTDSWGNGGNNLGNDSNWGNTGNNGNKWSNHDNSGSNWGNDDNSDSNHNSNGRNNGYDDWDNDSNNHNNHNRDTSWDSNSDNNNHGRNNKFNDWDNNSNGFNSDNWGNNNDWNNGYNSKKPKEIVGMALLRKFEDVINFFTSPNKVQHLINKNRFMWRDTLIKRERAFIKSLDNISDPKTRHKIKETLVKHSRTLLETAEYDLKLPKNNNNPTDNLKEFFSNSGKNVSGVKSFWAETIDMQSDILHRLETKNINTNTGSDEQIKKAKKLDTKLNAEIFAINDDYCDLLLVQITKGFDKSKANQKVKEKYKQIKQLQSHSRKNFKIYAIHNGLNIYEFKKDLQIRQDTPGVQIIKNKVKKNHGGNEKRDMHSNSNRRDRNQMQPSM